MLFLVAFLTLLSALAAFVRLSLREQRLAAGRAGLADLAAWTGITRRQELLAVRRVRETAEGALSFDPHFLDALPPHPLESYLPNGLCVALAIGALGSGVGPALPFLAGLTLIAALYQLLGTLSSLLIWLELRGQP